MNDQIDRPSNLAEELGRIVGTENVVTGEKDRAFLSKDIFTWDEMPIAEVAARPGSVEEVSCIAKLAAAHGYAIAPRGGGVSYTKGYAPEKAQTILIDLSRLNTICQINSEDRYIVVDAACTWQQIAEASKEFGLRPSMKGPISGTFATVGGTLSQNTASDSLEAVVGLEIVLADGTIVRTGSGARAASPSFFFRNYGPDLTGLFLGDTGAFGIKTKCAIALEPIPAAASFASFGFSTLEDLILTMADVSRSGIKCKMLGMDPLKSKTATKVTIGEGLTTIGNVITEAGSLTKGLQRALRIATRGRKALDDVDWSLHITIESHDQRMAESTATKIKSICGQTGEEIDPSVPMALYARPYSIRGILGIQGERWVPVHGVFPFSSIPAVTQAIQEYFSGQGDVLKRHGIRHSYITIALPTHWLIEPMFYWFDEVGRFTSTFLAKSTKNLRIFRPPQRLEKKLRGCVMRSQLCSKNWEPCILRSVSFTTSLEALIPTRMTFSQISRAF